MHYKVSFIIPYFNAGSTIQDTIDSIYNQTYPNYDIWIVNDGSTDPQSLEKLKAFENQDRITIIHQENAGPSVARTRAITQTSAEYLVLLDSDNKICQNTLNIAIPLLTNNDNIAAIYGNLYYFGEGTAPYIKEQEAFSIKKALIYNQIDTATVIKKAVFQKSGDFDEYMSRIGLEDWEFWIKITEDGWKLHKVNEVLFEIRLRTNSRTHISANPNVTNLKEYVYVKHKSTVIREYEKLYYEAKMLKETPDYRIGNRILKPWRLIKKWLRK